MSAQTEEIREQLLAGAQPYALQRDKGYPKATVYMVWNKLLDEGLAGPGVTPQPSTPTPPDLSTGNTPLSTNIAVRKPVARGSTKRTSEDALVGVDKVEAAGFGTKKMPTDVLATVRGALGMQVRPKVLLTPMPELLMSAMVISMNEFGWPAMRPDDFIDTVLDDWLTNAGIELNTYVKRQELQDVVDFAKRNGYTEWKLAKDSPPAPVAVMDKPEVNQSDVVAKPEAGIELDIDLDGGDDNGSAGGSAESAGPEGNNKHGGDTGEVKGTVGQDNGGTGGQPSNKV